MNFLPTWKGIVATIFAGWKSTDMKKKWLMFRVWTPFDPKQPASLVQNLYGAFLYIEPTWPHPVGIFFFKWEFEWYGSHWVTQRIQHSNLYLDDHTNLEWYHSDKHWGWMTSKSNISPYLLFDLWRNRNYLMWFTMNNKR